MAFTVVYDACVLYPAPLRDLLTRLGTAGLFRARWTNQILKNPPRSTDDILDLLERQGLAQSVAMLRGI